MKNANAAADKVARLTARYVLALRAAGQLELAAEVERVARQRLDLGSRAAA